MRKVSELSGVELDMLVAKAEGHDNVEIYYDEIKKKDCVCWVDVKGGIKQFGRFKNSIATWLPSSDWSQGGPIIFRERIAIYPQSDVLWDAHVGYGGRWLIDQPDPLIAAMRAYVASKFGDEVHDA